MRRRVERQGLGEPALAISFLPKESPDLLKQEEGWGSELKVGKPRAVRIQNQGLTRPKLAQY